MDNITEKISEILKKELPSQYLDKVNEFEHLILNDQYRAAFLLLNNLKKIKGWSPSPVLLSYYERFWWEIAN